MRYINLLLLLFFFLTSFAQEKTIGHHFFELKVYDYKTEEQEKTIDQFLSQAYLPFLHQNGISKIGVFGNYSVDSVTPKKIYVLIPHASMDQIPRLQKKLLSDRNVVEIGKYYLEATSENPAYTRITTYIIEGFRLAPHLMLPKLTSGYENRVYELRSYESASEKKYWKKVEMFNEGGEIDLFDKLNFNAIFYGEVVSGPTMPNLMYMTSFENMEDRNEHWKTFSNHPTWKALLSNKAYDKTVSKNVTLFLKAKSYSDF